MGHSDAHTVERHDLRARQVDVAEGIVITLNRAHRSDRTQLVKHPRALNVTGMDDVGATGERRGQARRQGLQILADVRVGDDADAHAQAGAPRSSASCTSRSTRSL